MAAWYEQDAIADNYLHLPAPPGPLIPKEPGQGPFRAAWDHRQDLAAVTARHHSHIPMPAPYRRFVHQQHPTEPGPATLRHLSRLRADQAHDPMPPNPVMAGHCPNRHHPRILNQTTGEPAGKTTGELVVVLEVPLPAVPTFEPATPPHQRCTAAAHPKITNPLRSPVPDPSTLEPALAAPRPLPG